MKTAQTLLPPDNIRSARLGDFTDLFVHLVNTSQTLCKSREGISEYLCQEVKRLTEERAWLVLRHQSSSTDQHVSLPAISFPVQFCQRTYGTLQIASDSAHPGSPALPLPIAHLLAQNCGLLLHMLELSALVEGQSRRLDRRETYTCLTNREQEVVTYPRVNAEASTLLPTLVASRPKGVCFPNPE